MRLPGIDGGEQRHFPFRLGVEPPQPPRRLSCDRRVGQIPAGRAGRVEHRRDLAGGLRRGGRSQGVSGGLDGLGRDGEPQSREPVMPVLEPQLHGEQRAVIEADRFFKREHGGVILARRVAHAPAGEVICIDGLVEFASRRLGRGRHGLQLRRDRRAARGRDQWRGRDHRR